MTTQDAIARIQGNGFIAALDQSGGSTRKHSKPMALKKVLGEAKKRCLNSFTTCAHALL